MKNISKVGLATALLMSLQLFTPVMAAEKQNSLGIGKAMEYYKVELINENSLHAVVSEAFNKDIEQFEKKETEKGIQFVSDSIIIDVNGVDLEQEGFQMVKMAMTTKKKELSPLLPASAKPLAQNEDIVNIKNALIEIKDEQAPELTVPETLKTQENQEINIDSLIEATDNSRDVDVQIDGEVNYAIPGIYTLNVQAKDASGNMTQKTIQVDVEKDDFYDRIAQAAKAQLGVYQDCTMLVTNALKAVGINFHGWPEEYLSLGDLTNDPVPGDIVVYSGHVGLYIGDGQVVHGGWNGNQTVIASVECDKPLIGFVHVRKP